RPSAVRSGTRRATPSARWAKATSTDCDVWGVAPALRGGPRASCSSPDPRVKRPISAPRRRGPGLAERVNHEADAPETGRRSRQRPSSPNILEDFMNKLASSRSLFALFLAASGALAGCQMGGEGVDQATELLSSDGDSAVASDDQ